MRITVAKFYQSLMDGFIRAEYLTVLSHKGFRRDENGNQYEAWDTLQVEGLDAVEAFRLFTLWQKVRFEMRVAKRTENLKNATFNYWRIFIPHKDKRRKPLVEERGDSVVEAFKKLAARKDLEDAGVYK